MGMMAPERLEIFSCTHSQAQNDMNHVSFSVSCQGPDQHFSQIREYANNKS